jgi:hypothetical protein
LAVFFFAARFFVVLANVISLIQLARIERLA